MQENDIVAIYGHDAAEMTKKLLEAIDLAKLVGDRHASVALKPNLVIAARPESGATTHPAIVVAIIEYLRARGFDTIRIVESAWVGDSTKRGFAVNGYDAISKKYAVPLVDVKDDAYQKITAQGITMEVSQTILDTDFLISLPVLKGHCQLAMTCALKNMKGCLSDRSKRLFHSLGLNKPIAALNTIRKADLVIVDSLNGDMDFEEGGNPVRTDRMFAARDSVLCDSYGASLMGFAIDDIPYIRMANDMGVGTCDLSKANIVSLNEPTVASDPHPTGAVADLARHTRAKSACSACYGNLIHALKRLEETDHLEALVQPVCIGQGYWDIHDAKSLGVGSCTRNLGKSLSGCPPKAIDMITFLKEQDLR